MHAVFQLDIAKYIRYIYIYIVEAICHIIFDSGTWDPFQRILFPDLPYSALGPYAQASGRDQTTPKTTGTGTGKKSKVGSTVPLPECSRISVIPN